MVSAFANCFKIPELRSRIIFTLSLIVVARLGAVIPLPGVDASVLQAFFDEQAQQQSGTLLQMFNLFSGGALSNCAIFALTIMPYISASIIMQLATGVFPRLSKLSREEGGRQKITQYTRLLTLGLCVVQSFLLAQALLNPQSLFQGIGEGLVVAEMRKNPFFFYFTTIVTLTAGTMALMWLGEKITEKGIGNGISIIIAVGILSKLPVGIASGWAVLVANPESGFRPLVIVLLIGFLFGVIACTVMITQAVRKVHVQYAKVVRGNKVYGGQSSYLPLKVNYAGVMPIIFASSLLLFPTQIVKMAFPGAAWATTVTDALSPSSFLFYVLTGGMIFFFSYFWVAIMFNPIQIADDLKRQGGFVPGVRPGQPTAKFLDYTMTRLTFAGAVFLTILALLPSVVSLYLNVPYMTAQFFGGTGLLIIVGVALDTMRQTETYLLQRHYDGFLKKGRVRGRQLAGSASTGEALSNESLVWLVFFVGAIIVLGMVFQAIQSLGGT